MKLFAMFFFGRLWGFPHARRRDGRGRTVGSMFCTMFTRGANTRTARCGRLQDTLAEPRGRRTDQRINGDQADKRNDLTYFMSTV